MGAGGSEGGFGGGGGVNGNGGGGGYIGGRGSDNYVEPGQNGSSFINKRGRQPKLNPDHIPTCHAALVRITLMTFDE